MIIMISFSQPFDCSTAISTILFREKMGIENILINNIGTVIGSHTGPGVVAVFCMGNER